MRKAVSNLQYWRKRKLNYDILIPKLDKNIYDLTEQETAEYFDWYVEQIPQRVEYLSQVCATQMKVPKEKLDCSPESLLILWKWFRKSAKTERIPNGRQLTLETEYILRDIGMYLGETFRKNKEGTYWTYYTKPQNDFFVNTPLLKGFVDMSAGKPFYAAFEPVHMARMQACKILKHKSKDDDLLNLYHIWDRMQTQ